MYTPAFFVQHKNGVGALWPDLRLRVSTPPYPIMDKDCLISTATSIMDPDNARTEMGFRNRGVGEIHPPSWEGSVFKFRGLPLSG